MTASGVHGILYGFVGWRAKLVNVTLCWYANNYSMHVFSWVVWWWRTTIFRWLQKIVFSPSFLDVWSKGDFLVNQWRTRPISMAIKSGETNYGIIWNPSLTHSEQLCWKHGRSIRKQNTLSPIFQNFVWTMRIVKSQGNPRNLRDISLDSLVAQAQLGCQWTHRSLVSIVSEQPHKVVVNIVEPYQPKYGIWSKESRRYDQPQFGICS